LTRNFLINLIRDSVTKIWFIFCINY